jgi:uncharacterized protein RhaS with RHS repeats
LGRFISEDPLGLGGGANYYAYAAGDPISNSDPLGLFITSVDAACVMDPGFCAEIMGQMFQNVAAVSGDACLQQFADKFSGQLRGLATLAAILPFAIEGSALRTWGNPKTLEDHFARHGGDFGATSAEEYAQQASDFLVRAQAEGLPTKIDAEGVIRVYDPERNIFGAFNPNGTTRTFFSPSSPSYFDRQPGNMVP